MYNLTNTESFQNVEITENQINNYEEVLQKYINENNICDSEIKQSDYDDNKIYQLENTNEKVSPYNLLSKNNISKFCSDINLGNKYFKNNKNILKSFMNKYVNKKCVKNSNIDKQTYEPVYIESDKTISNDNIKYNNEKILNGGEFFDGILGFSNNDLNDNFAPYDTI
tara:strand:+ start:3205 stop:3708 length:504 start_codon:yes stop_codon:yes gene_type:complete